VRAERRVSGVGQAIEYASFEGEIRDADLDGLVALHDAIFGVSTSPASFRDRLVGKHGLLVVLARRAGEIVGYKIGYARSQEEFYSWLGGVAVHARRLGIASELMRRQHERVRALGYRRIVTETKNEWREMMILDLRHGFDVVGAYTDERSEPRAILVKTLG
jgi:ribosomal protein S18 acetylase RimI-like enzyme